jgi:hypothetical protein
MNERKTQALAAARSPPANPPRTRLFSDTRVLEPSIILKNQKGHGISYQKWAPKFTLVILNLADLNFFTSILTGVVWKQFIKSNEIANLI